jgi:hypothetical protein
MSIATRLQRLERALAGGTCDGLAVHLVVYRRGESTPMVPVPADAQPCASCGAVHVQIVEEVVIGTRQHWEAYRRQQPGPS